MRSRRRSPLDLLLPVVVTFAACGANARPQPRILVAASFEEAASRVVGDTAIVAPAASSAQARRIVAGAPADVFVSANREWMDYVERHDRIIPGSRRALVRNEVVLVTPGRRPRPAFDLQTFRGTIAMGDPSHVPAGVYGKRALESAGVWDRVVDRVIPTAHVRQALALVERNEVDLGVVYRTDAQRSERVAIAHEFDPSRAPIVEYEVALIRGGDPAVLLQLIGDAAAEIYREFGFRPPNRP